MALPRQRVAIVGCRAIHGGDASNLYPDADWPLLSAALRRTRAEATAVAWDDEGVDWAQVDLAVINSTWDSVDRPDEYVSWARRTSRTTTLLNPVASVAWNIDKVYLRDLQARGVPIPPTEWVVDADCWEPPRHEIVVKPSISAGGRDTARYQPHEREAAVAHVRRVVGCGQTAMVQPYIGSVDTDGETKMVFIQGEFSHAVRVGALLERGEGVLGRPWEKVVPMEATTATTVQLDMARAVLAAVKAEVGGSLLHARVDLVTAPTGRPLLGEVELIDPSLLLRFVPPAARRLAEAIATLAERSVRNR